MINRYNQESRIIGALPRFTSSATTATLSHALVRDRVVHLQKCKNDFKRRGAATLQPPSQALIRLVPQLSQIWSQISLFSASVPDTTKNHRQVRVAGCYSQVPRATSANHAAHGFAVVWRRKACGR